MNGTAYKVIATLFWLFLAGHHLQSQYHPDLHTLHYQNSEGEKGITTYIYNGRKLPYKAIWELEDGSRWSVNLHEFNASGRIIHKSRIFSDSLSSVEEFKYDQQGRLTGETFSRSDGVSGMVSYQYEGGLKRKAVCESYLGWFSGTINYHYDENGHRDSATLFMEDKRIGAISYRYTRGQLNRETWTFTQGFSQEFQYNYLDRSCTPHHSSNIFLSPSCRWRVERETYDFNGKGGGPSSYSYNPEGALVKKTFTRNDGLETSTTYAYDSTGHLLHSIRHYNDGSKGIFEYIYNPEGRLEERLFRKNDTLFSTETYAYDIPGRLVSGQYTNFDGWLTGKLEFKHDRYDRIIGARFNSEDSHSADLIFTYDPKGRLIRIHWAFDGGYSQTYDFSYVPIPRM